MLSYKVMDLSLSDNRENCAQVQEFSVVNVEGVVCIYFKHSDICSTCDFRIFHTFIMQIYIFRILLAL